jgi:putative ABC transport system ATP-binding protein
MAEIGREQLPQDAPIIIAEHIHKTYDNGRVQVKALLDVSLAVERGEIVAVMGPSGCGKTTLLNCLSGLDEFDSGDIRIEGTSLQQMSDVKRTTYRAQRMGFVFQTYNLLPVLTAVENVEMPLLVSGTTPKQAREQALSVLAQVGLAERAHHRPAELSGGQSQRVTIARSLVNHPAIIWADEPTGNLDSQTADEILTMLLELNQTYQQTFVIVTHDPQVGDRCDRIIRMRDGRVIEA